MFNKRDGDPFPTGWWILAVATVLFALITVVLILASIWILSWQALVTGVVTCVIAIVLGVCAAFWADDMT